MASGSTARWRTDSCQASAEHFQQCAESPPLRNRGLGPLAVTVLAIALARRAFATANPEQHAVWSVAMCWPQSMGRPHSALR